MRVKEVMRGLGGSQPFPPSALPPSALPPVAPHLPPPLFPLWQYAYRYPFLIIISTFCQTYKTPDE